MNTLNMLGGFIKKEKDTDALKMQLVKDGIPFEIPENAITKIIIKLNEQNLINENATIVDRINGVISFYTPLKVGKYSLEVVCIYDGGNEKITFPTVNYENVQIIANLKEE